MTERMNVRRLQVPDEITDTGSRFDLRRDFTDADRKVWRKRFEERMQSFPNQWDTTARLARDLRIIYPDNPPTFTQDQWLVIVEKLRLLENGLIESSAAVASWETYFSHVANAKLGYPQGVYALSREAEQRLLDRVDRRPSSPPAIRAIANAKIISPKIAQLSEAEIVGLYNELQHELELISRPASTRGSGNVWSRWARFSSWAAGARIIAPSHKLDIGERSWVQVRNRIGALRIENNGGTLQFPAFVADMAVVAANSVVLTEANGLELSYKESESHREIVPDMPKSLEL